MSICRDCIVDPEGLNMKIHNIDPLKSFLSLKARFTGAFFFRSETVTVIGLDQEEMIRLVGNRLEVTKLGLTQELECDFLEYLKERLKVHGIEGDFSPYQNGGAFGCIGYEVMGLIEPKLKGAGYFKELPRGNEILAEIFLSHNLIIFDYKNNEIQFALRDHFLTLADLEKAALEAPCSTAKDIDFSNLTATMGKEKFIQGVKAIKSHISVGNIFQAVLSERFELPVRSSARELFESVSKNCPSSYGFYFDFKGSSFFGASPEALLKVQNGEMETHPIAGTRPRGRDPESDSLLESELLADEKEAAEHLMLVDLSRNDLGRVSEAGSISVHKFREVMRLPNVMHLVSIVRGQKKKDKSDLEAFIACFPAGTLSGAPKIRAMEILSQIEQRPRGFYGGAVVAFDFSGGLDSCIAIRSIEVKDAKAILRAGAGIVADSDPESEYQEVQHKLKNLLFATQLAEAKHFALPEEIA